VPRIGFSTGALAKGDVAEGLALSRQLGLKTVELSALRLQELPVLIAFVRVHDLTDFQYVSVHAPTDVPAQEEARVASALSRLSSEHEWPIVLHPDCVHDFDHWRPLGEFVFVENMDKRKRIGRTVEELEQVLTLLPEAQICFDIAHARQVDSSMTEAYRILTRFAGRIRQLHISEVNSDSRHDRISESALRAYGEVVRCLPLDVPVIIETPANTADPASQIRQTERLYAMADRPNARIA
jgi:hypothetical protein